MARTTAGRRRAAAREPASARDLAMSRVAHRAREFPALFPSPLDPGSLSPRDAALAWAIDQAVARHWITLQTVVSVPLRRPWPQLHPTVQAALLVGAAQLLLLERVPDHAVINEAVQWVKTRSAPAASLVNAVLRRVANLRAGVEAWPPTRGWDRDTLPLPDGRVVRLTAPVFAEDELDRLVQQTSHPRPLLERWAEREGAAGAADLAAHGLVHPPVIVTGAALPSEWPAHEQQGFAVYPGDRSKLETILRGAPALRVQDPASAAAVAATAELAPALIVELCAGKGTQTHQLAELHPQARILATDASAEKVAALREQFRHHERVTVVDPAENALVDLAGRADLVVADVPCSNTGVLARRVEAKYRFSAAAQQELVGIQHQILADAMRLPAPGGRVLYCTCSLEPEENEQQAAWLARWHGVQIERETRLRPAGRPGDAPTTYRDGAYFFLAVRPTGPA